MQWINAAHRGRSLRPGVVCMAFPNLSRPTAEAAVSRFTPRQLGLVVSLTNSPFMLGLASVLRHLERRDRMAIDPVCGMKVEEATAAAKSEYKGKVYYFCSSDCKRTFDQDPEKYL